MIHNLRPGSGRGDDCRSKCHVAPRLGPVEREHRNEPNSHDTGCDREEATGARAPERGCDPRFMLTKLLEPGVQPSGEIGGGLDRSEIAKNEETTADRCIAPLT